MQEGDSWKLRASFRNSSFSEQQQKLSLRGKQVQNGEILAAVPTSPLFLRSLIHAKAFLFTLARAIECWSHCFGLRNLPDWDICMKDACCPVYLPELKTDFNHRFGILEIEINPVFCLLSSPSPPALPPHQAQTMLSPVPCSTHLLPRNRRPGNLPGWPCWSRMVSGVHAFFCAQRSEGCSPCSTGTAHVKVARTWGCSLLAGCCINNKCTKAVQGLTLGTASCFFAVHQVQTWARELLTSFSFLPQHGVQFRN